MRCALCPGVHRCLPPDGPEDAEIVFIGEAPGINEEKHGKVFIGKTGDEVNRGYLPLAGLKRESALFTNAIRCYPTSAGGKLDPSRAQDVALLESCAATHLWPLLERGHARVVVPLGSFACRAVSPDIDLELQHGFPVTGDWGIPIFPMYHPALGIHEPKKMLYLRTDWQRLKDYLRGKLQLPVDRYPSPDYVEVTSTDQMRRELDPSRPLACDTESSRRTGPFCLTYTQDAGVGRLIRAERVDLLYELQRFWDRWNAPILFHNWLYDWTVIEALGLRVPYRRIVDTMSRVFHLGNLPQGLKALALRECGMTMEDFEDLVIPYSREKVLDYYRQAQEVTWPKPEPDLVPDANGAWKIYKAQSMNTKLKRFFTDYGKNPNKDVFKMWEENWTEQQPMLEEQLGPYPGMDISHVPFAKVLHYACRDVDALIRVWPIIQRMAAVVRKRPQDQWRAAYAAV